MHSYSQKCISYSKWSQERYKYEDYGMLKKVNSGHYSRDWFHNFNYKLVKDDIGKLQYIYRLLEKYYADQIKQITYGLELFSDSFEQNRSIYAFTDLIESFETMLNNPKKIYDTDKSRVLKDLEAAIKRIEKESDNVKIVKILNSLSTYRGIQTAISLYRKLMYEDETVRDASKAFQAFISPDPKIGGCYSIRNALMHGNIDENITKKIINVLPRLSEYIGQLILKLIELRIEESLDCDEESYFETLDKIISK